MPSSKWAPYGREAGVSGDAQVESKPDGLGRGKKWVSALEAEVARLKEQQLASKRALEEARRRRDNRQEKTRNARSPNQMKR